MESNETQTLGEAVGLYVSSIKSKGSQDGVQKELVRFVNWYGRERPFSQISPSEIGDYADQVAGSGTTPQAAERLQAVRGFLSYVRKTGLTDKNLAQHVRVRKLKGRTGKGGGKDANNTVELTPDGHAQLVAQFEKLRAERAPLAQQIQKAAADKDVRENVPLEAAREQLGHLESRIRTIESTLNSAVIIDPASRKSGLTAKLGARVSVKDLSTGRETRYTLVSPLEANPLEGRLSNASPLGHALMGCAADQEVEAKTPGGTVRYRILSVTS